MSKGPMKATKFMLAMVCCIVACAPLSGATGGGSPPHYNIWVAGDSLSVASAWPAHAGARPTHSIAAVTDAEAR